MIQAAFERIAKHGLTDWAVVLQGVCGIPSLLGRLPAFCVENFAIAELETVAGNNPFFDEREKGTDLFFARRIEMACPYLVLLNKSVPISAFSLSPFSL